MKYSEKFESIDKEYLTDLEKCFSYIIDKKYADFIINNGGGMAKDNSIDIKNEKYSIDYILGNSNDYIYDLKKFNSTFKFFKNHEYLVIGTFIGGDLMVMKSKEPNIYIYYHEEDRCEKISENLKKLLNQIKQ